jgi:hypothetical protein
MVLIVFAGIAEFEPALMHERTSTAELQRGGTVCASVDRWALSAEQLVLGRRLVRSRGKAHDVAKMRRPGPLLCPLQRTARDLAPLQEFPQPSLNPQR